MVERLSAQEVAIQESGSGWTLEIRSGWVAAPFATSPDEVCADPAPVVAAALISGDPFVLIYVPRVPADEQWKTVASSPAEISAGMAQLVIHDVIVTSPATRWFALITETEYGLALGESEPVEALLGYSPQQARTRFHEYVDEWQKPPNYLRAIANMPWDEYTVPVVRERVVRVPPAAR